MANQYKFNNQLPDKEETLKCVKTIQELKKNKSNGKKLDDAQTELIKTNGRLVKAVIGRYYPFVNKNENMFDDAMQEGMLGLLHAAEKYDFEKETSFSTYAFLWIKSYVGKYLKENTHIVTIPTNQVDNLYQMKKAETEFINKGITNISDEMLSKASKVPLEDVMILKDFLKEPAYLDEYIDNDSESMTLGETISSGDFEKFEHMQDIAELASTMEMLIKRASKGKETHEDMFMRCYGLGKYKETGEQSYRQIAAVYGISAERVRNICNRIFKRIRHVSNKKELLPFRYGDW